MKTSASSRKKLADKPKKLPEQAIHLLCWQWATREHPDLLIFHVANERKGSVGMALHFKRMGVLPGVADFLAFPTGALRAAIEIKDADGKQSPAQRDFERRWVAAGGFYFLVRSLEEFQGIVNAITFRTGTRTTSQRQS